MNPSVNQKKAIGARIKLARSALGITQEEMCERAGMKLPSLRDYELGNSIPGGAAVAALATIGINANWILTGVGEVLISPDDGSLLYSESHEPAQLLGEHRVEESIGAAYIDQYVDARGSAGPGSIASDEVIVKVRLDATLLRERVGCNLNRIKIATVSGDSMYPTLSHGDQVLIDTSCTAFVDDAIYAIQQDGFLRFKRIKKMLDGTIVVKSDNESLNAAETYTAEQAQYFNVVGQILPFKVGRFRI